MRPSPAAQPRSRKMQAVPCTLAILLLVGCASPPGGAPSPDAPPAPSAAEPESEPAFALDAFDFGNAEWSFVPDTTISPSISLALVDGAAEVNGVQFTLDAEGIVFSDADDDGDLDAIVPIEGSGGGNIIDRQWYLWANHEAAAVQVAMPVARTMHCGTYTEAVGAVDGGFEIHEFRRAIGEETLACSEPGSDERVRTVGITDQGPDGALWPVQRAPFPAFGGVCPEAVEYDAYPVSVNVYEVPNAETEPLAVDGLYEWALAERPIFTTTAPKWRLIGVRTSEGMGCAWVPASG